MKAGRKYRDAAAKVEAEKLYTLDEAVKLVKETSFTKFDASIEIHMNLGIDPRQAEQQIRATVALPHGTGKTVKVIAFVGDDNIDEAKKAGAIEAGNETLVTKIQEGWLDFDKAVATPDMMKQIAKIARTLGQAGKMPNPKAGTVGLDISKMVGEIMKGQVEYRNDKFSNLHNVVGKASFSEEHLKENLVTYLKAVQDKKPDKMKGIYIKSITLAASMGPGIPVEVNTTISEL
ncbi:MAG: large subunit ribosomal protein L1 [Oceanicoccus sp.]|jgi:large subunit ribosomal protein L1